MGPVKPWLKLKLSSDNAHEHALEYTQNLVFDKDYHLATQVHVNKDFAVDSAYAYGAMVGPHGNYYVRSQLMKWFVGAGTWLKDGSGNHHSVEVQYDAKDNTEGMFGQPLFLRYGGKFKYEKFDLAT